MFQNYLKVAWRNLLRHKVFSGINIIGLAIGMAACLLILQYVAFELSYDNFHSKGDRIYRVRQDRYNEGKLSTEWVSGAYAAGNSFKDAYDEIEDYVKIVGTGSVVAAAADGEQMKVEKVYYASQAFFSIFSYPLIAGDARTALLEPNTVALSESVARKLFGTTNPLGKTLRINREQVVKVTGVYKDFGMNSHLKADLLRSYATFIKNMGADNNPETAWQWDGCLTYLLLRPGTNPQALEAKFPAVVDRLAGADHKKYHSAAIYTLQPLRDIHLYSHYLGETEPNGDGKTVYLLLAIAFFIVVIAWVNYVNLATARAISRAREVGVRKAVGSQRSQLMGQFMLESFLLNSLAVVLALVLVLITIPVFNNLSGQQLSLSLLGSGRFWLALLILFVVGVFFSGLYPAFVLSGLRPVTVLKGRMVNTRQGILLRKGLVVFQFVASLFLLVGTMAVFRQIEFMRQQTLGLSIDQTLVIRPPIISNDSTYLQQMKAFKDEVSRQSAIKSITASTSIPGDAVGWNAGGIRIKGTDESRGKQYRVIGVDYDYLDAYGLRLLAGRNFARDFGTDPKAVVFNKMALQQLGFLQPKEAIGKEIDFWGETFTIVGVVDNFHQQSLREAYEPLILRLIPDVRGYFSVKIAPAEADRTIATVRTAWNQFFPGNPFDFFFLDAHFADQYRADQRFGQVFGFFTGLAILVACLGLFGLASFTTTQRTKEIGIRKVLGASISEILRLLYKEFAQLVVIAFAIATPLAWFAVTRWRESYAFRADLNGWLFIMPFIAVLAIALLTVSFQSIKAALMDPVKSLRSE
ncbi:ABC transporter permease [Spirosoma utsteinense]|uniref:ABC transport system permease protein n=1 Tax=Spirosoma utsteinense TaxID=2585773 RepID=A0ABR6W5F7_9BACT|nr:ABC transporter permease [Spirosoma utsteinense]MBC3788568.1 putative ABC transport system permease protein [Spirosoma utsteinense]MBC3791825.1 putative ABC transport system permease protein [Spirosoma utsteinense]